MDRNDLLEIICKIKYSNTAFETIQSFLIYELAERRYQIHFKKEEGRLINFELEDIGAVANERN